MKKSLYAFALPLVFFSLTGFESFSQDMQTITEDINQDGATDSLSYYYDGGSGFGGTTVRVFDGATGKSFELSSYGSFACFFKSIPVDDFFWKEKNRLYLPRLKSILAKNAQETQTDDTWQWLADTYMQNPESLNPASIKTKVVWKKELRLLPQISLFTVSNDTLEVLARHGQGLGLPKGLSAASKGWLIYYGHNHFLDDGFINQRKFPKKVFSSEAGELFLTKHALIAQKKDGLKALLVVHDCFLFDSGPQKLRYASIGQAVWSGDYVFFDHLAPMQGLREVYKINLKNGNISRIFSQNNLLSLELSLQGPYLELHYDDGEGNKGHEKISVK